ncbi:MAG: NmrA/HSCARG family protein [Gemmatimonadota bacterium]
MTVEKQGVILVTGATGQQGGAVARSLLAAGQPVRALTRDRSKAAPLAALGAEIAEGDMTAPSSVEAALRGARAVYAMTTPFEQGMAAEVEQGVRFADAARAAGVDHYVFTSVASADKNTGIPHFETKWQVEQHIHSIGLPATILRPVFFMENFVSPWFWPSISQGQMVLPMRPETKLQMIALDDIGAYGAAALLEPDTFRGQAIELAGDSHTMPEAAEIIGRASGRPVEFTPLPDEQAEAAIGHDLALMFKWFNDVGYVVDVPALERRFGVPATSLEQWAEACDWPAPA